jgi:hypothetical protein
MPAWYSTPAGIYFANLAAMNTTRYILGSLMIIAGALAVAGVLEPRFVDPQNGARLRVMFGLVLILFGVFRIATLEISRRRRDREAHINEGA